MKKAQSLLLLTVLLSAFISTFPLLAWATAEPVTLTIIEWEAPQKAITYAIPPTDDSMTNPHYLLLSYHSYNTINYYINTKNSYGFSSSAVVSTITASVNTWDKETSYQVFSYVGTTTRTAGKLDGYNTIAWGKYRAGVIAVTMSWVSGGRTVEVDCMMNTRFQWSLTGEAGKMDVQNIMTHELGHFCGLADLYSDVDYWLTMYGYSNYGLTYARTLGLGDINGLEAVYGS